jgi:hypothetical protein
MAVTASKATGQPTLMPTNKVIAGAVAGALVTIIVYVLNTYVLTTNKLPADISSALTTVVSAILAWFTNPSLDQTTM